MQNHAYGIVTLIFSYHIGTQSYCHEYCGCCRLLVNRGTPTVPSPIFNQQINNSRKLDKTQNSQANEDKAREFHFCISLVSA